jgi:uncharacterized protein (DUF305 family)
MRMRVTSVLALLIALPLAACGGGGDTAAAEDPNFNQTDVRFSEMMRPHHLQAVRNAEAEIERGSDPRVKRLAQMIRRSQIEEAAQLQQFQRTFGKQQMPAAPDQQARWDENHAELAAASGARADVIFLTNMIPHHAAALPMAQLELDQGAYGPAKKLAGQIKQAQLSEIKEMKAIVREKAAGN